MILRDQMQMQEILAAHALWLRGGRGKCADLRDANLSGVNLSGANLRAADLRDANLRGADLHGANLRYANLSGANLIGVNLSGADMISTKLSGANLRAANLSGAVLSSDTKSLGAPARRVTRSDGYEFLLWLTDKGWRITAGCRWFTPTEARAHWMDTRPRIGDEMGDETHDILDFFDAHIARSAAP